MIGRSKTHRLPTDSGGQDFRHGIAGRIGLLIVVLLVVPLAILGALGFRAYQRLHATRTIESYERSILQYSQYVHRRLIDNGNYLNSIRYHAGLQEIISIGPIARHRTIEVNARMEEIVGFYMANRDIISLIYYSLSNDFPSDGEFVRNFAKLAELQIAPFLFADHDQEAVVVWNTRPQTGNRMTVSAPIFPYAPGSPDRFPSGLLLCTFDADSFFNLIAAGSPWTAIIEDRYGNRIYQDRSLAVPTAGFVPVGGIESPLQRLETEDGIWNIQELPVFGLRLYTHLPRATLRALPPTVYLVLLGVVLSLVSIIVVIVLFVQRSVSDRMVRIIAKMQRVSGGDLSDRAAIEGNDEIAVIDGYLNEMIRQLERTINEQYLQAIRLNEAEKEALQSQINPHFLYNTLETMAAIAEESGSSNVAEIGRRLGGILRYNINRSGERFTTLDDELQHVANYLYIQRQRHRNRFECVMDIDPKARRAKVVKFCLQPIVENAFQHGLDMRDGHGVVSISASVEAGELVIGVEDDGAGIDEESLRALQRELTASVDGALSEVKAHLGMRNVNSRLKLAYGARSGVVLNSRKGFGTQVILRLPYVDAPEPEMRDSGP